MPNAIATVILAAGQGTRMKSDLPKVLHRLGGEPMVSYPIRLATELGSDQIVVVVGHGGDQVEAFTKQSFGDQIRFVTQETQEGTGHATRVGMTGVDDDFAGRVLILYGDVPLLTRATVQAMSDRMDETGEKIGLITTELENPFGYGRIVREDGLVRRIVEEKDATDEERKIREVNAGIYLVEAAFLRSALARLSNDNAQGEYYLTDIVGFAIGDGLTVGTVLAPPEEVRGANRRSELAELAAMLRRRINTAHMDAGVSIVDPERTYIGDRVTIGRDTTIEPGVHLRGDTKIGKGCHIDAGCVVTDAVVEDGVRINPYSVLEEATVRNDATIGPFTRLRPKADIGEGARVGNFVEIKKTKLAKGAKANHLAYLGDAVVGEKANVGAGTITCNYDGYGKHLTEIGDGVFVGSNSTLVAPVKLGAGAYIGAGSTITDEVGQDDLALGRGRQVNKQGRAAQVRADAKKRSGK